MTQFCPTNMNLCVTRGDTPVIGLRLSDSDGNLLDLTGGTFKMSVDSLEEPPDGSTLIFEVVGTVSSSEDGSVSFQPLLTNQGWNDIVPGEYFYDVQMTLNGEIRTILKGTFDVVQDITK